MKKSNIIKIVIVVILVLVIVAIFIYKNNNKIEINNVDKKENEVNVYTNEVALPSLLEFTSSTCEPCLIMVPIIDKVKEDYKGKVNVKFVDVYKESSTTRKYNIRVTPTQIFLDSKGNIVYRHEGIFEEDEIVNKFKEMGIK